MFISLSDVCTLATLFDVSTIHARASSWHIANTPLSTPCMARMKRSEHSLGSTVCASALPMLKSIIGSLTWNSSSTLAVNMFQSARTVSFSLAGTAKTMTPSRGIALCNLPELNCARRRSIFSCSLYRKRERILMAFARFLLMSSPECPPFSPLMEAWMKKWPSGAASRVNVNLAEVVFPPAHEMNIWPSSSESRLMSMSPFMNPALIPIAPVRLVSSSRVKTHSNGPCSMSSLSRIASSMAQPMPSSAPSVVPLAVSHSPSM